MFIALNTTAPSASRLSRPATARGCSVVESTSAVGTESLTLNQVERGGPGEGDVKGVGISNNVLFFWKIS